MFVVYLAKSHDVTETRKKELKKLEKAILDVTERRNRRTTQTTTEKKSCMGYEKNSRKIKVNSTKGRHCIAS